MQRVCANRPTRVFGSHWYDKLLFTHLARERPRLPLKGKLSKIIDF